MKRITNTRNCSPTPLRHSGLTPSRQRKETQTLLKVYPLSFSGKCIFTVRLASRPCDTRKHRSLSLSLAHFSSLSFPSYEYDRRGESARRSPLCLQGESCKWSMPRYSVTFAFLAWVKVDRWQEEFEVEKSK